MEMCQFPRTSVLKYPEQKAVYHCKSDADPASGAEITRHSGGVAPNLLRAKLIGRSRETRIDWTSAASLLFFTANGAGAEQ
jgi:hypothetical protein